MALTAVVCLLVAGTASAQSGFVEGAIGREVKRFSSEPGERLFDGTASDVAIGAAGFLTPHWTIGLEVDVGGRSTVRRSSQVTVSGRPTTIDTDYSIERRSAAALVGYHTAPRRVRLGYYAGWSFTFTRREIASTAPPIVVTNPPAVSVFTDRVAGLVVGIDAAIALTDHIALVPTFRAQAVALSPDLTGHSYRPGIGARVTF
jgi:hypothetical protein